jgi:RNA-directed DNA polymerase
MEPPGIPGRFTSPNRNYLWVFEADIKACFDEIDHSALMGRVRRRIGDKRILALVKAFLRAGVLSEDGVSRATIAGTPQGGTLSPLLANVAWTGSGSGQPSRVE